MPFDLDLWKRKIADSLRSASVRTQLALRGTPVTAYGLLCGLALSPVAEAFRTGDPAQMIGAATTLGGVVGGNLLANMAQQARDASALAAAADATRDPEILTALDAMLDKLEVIAETAKLLAPDERTRFVEALRTDAQQTGVAVHIEATARAVVALQNSGIISTGDNARINQGGVFIEHLHVTYGEVRASKISQYLVQLRNQCNRLRLGPLGGREGADDDKHPLTLDRVYIDLDTTTAKEREKRAREADVQALMEREARLSALEVAAREERLVLRGAPGAGKSAFVNQLTATLAGVRLRECPLPAALSSAPLPVLTTLRRLAPTLEALDLRGLSAETRERRLVDALWDHWRAELSALRAPGFADELNDLLVAGDVWLIFDGWDEVAGELRPLVRETVAAVRGAYANVRRMLITCRIRSYDEAHFPGFSPHTLAPFTPAQIRRFAQLWYACQAREPILRFSDPEAEARGRDLADAALDHDLRELAENPMLLTIMAIVHQDQTTLPKQRVRLFAKAIEVLLKRWQETKQRKASDALKKLLQEDDRLLKGLRAVAYVAHEQQARDRTARRDREADRAPADLPGRAIVRILRETSTIVDDTLAGEFLDYVDQFAGLLVGHGDSTDRLEQTYSFPHRQFQEYLAGCQMVFPDARDAGRIHTYRSKAQADDDFWAEAARMGLEAFRFSNDTEKWVLRDLAYHLCPPDAPANNAARRETLWASHVVSLVEPDDWAKDTVSAADERVQGGQPFLARLPQRLLESLTASSFPAQERAEAGRALARLGDLRREVLTVEAMPFCLVPSGPFERGTNKGEDELSYGDEYPRRSVDIPHDYWIGRFPVTNAQYAQFCTAGGYANRAYWFEAEAAGLWRDGRAGKGWYVLDDQGKVKRDQLEWFDGPRGYGTPYDLPNHPVVGIGWYEALAFTRWLTDALALRSRGLEAALPSEEEWEKAARGGHRIPSAGAHRLVEPTALGDFTRPAMAANPQRARVYPWGNAPDANRANYSDTAIGTTSAVGCFPTGASPYGCEELSGNVWEWCLTKWQADYNNYRSDALNEIGGLETRVIRGGSFGDNQRLVRCAYRYNPLPDLNNDVLGLRVVVRAHSSRL
ncbi:MAG: SUMF1/EgtB/PvdO family nonheme iron enzyme [Chloroflexi bacterium]|nr:SUMF1/EgtB/PvdO family nonheme iron enzyme [Chloroflexota bacterium]